MGGDILKCSICGGKGYHAECSSKYVYDNFKGTSLYEMYRKLCPELFKQYELMEGLQ